MLAELGKQNSSLPDCRNNVGSLYAPASSSGGIEVRVAEPWGGCDSSPGLGLGGKIASGKQGMSWLHELDMNRIFERAITDESMRGAYIASSPEPESQRDFMRKLRRALRMPIGLPATELMVRFGAHWLLRTDPELALYGRYVMPKRLVDEGFSFEYPDLEKALSNLCKRD